MNQSHSLIRTPLGFIWLFCLIAGTQAQTSNDDSNSSPLLKNDAISFETGFEINEPGVFKVLETEIGVWKSRTGICRVDNQHARSGRNCLQLEGGNKTVALLELAHPLPADSSLAFWAERWTGRAPFTFIVEKSVNSDWEEIFDGSQIVRVGRSFLSRVEIPLGAAPVRRLRFSVSSPEQTGILLDDLRFISNQCQEITTVAVEDLTLPALRGVLDSPLLKLRIHTIGKRNPLMPKRMKFALSEETDLADWKSFRVYGGNSKQITGDPLAEIELKNFTSKDKIFDLELSEIPLLDGSNYLWITGELSQQANIDHEVEALCQRIIFSDGQSFEPNPGNSSQRLGVALRKSGDDGVHTYRIPGLATTNEGTLIAVYDVRRRSGGDLPGDIDVGMSRSMDGGHSWEPMRIIMDMGNDPKWNYDGIGDPAILVDRNTGVIWVAATWSHGNRSWHGSGPGLFPEETGQLMLVKSEDAGLTWSEPINITQQIKKPEWSFVLQGPGKGITMQDGTLVFAAQYQDSPEQQRLPHSTIIYSRDHGQTWKAGNGAFDDTTESQVIELNPGVLMLNCRYNRSSRRIVMTTEDMGQTWKQHPSSDSALIEPIACMGSLIHVDREAGKKLGGWLLFSNPNSLQARNHITIKASNDSGISWPEKYHLLLDENDSAGYSCMTMIDNETVGILYEGSQAHMTFQRIALKEIIGSNFQ